MKLRAEIGSAMLLLGCLASVSALSAQQVACAIQKSPTDPASVAFRQGDFSKAFELYSSAAKNNPKDMQAIAGQIRSLLQEDQISEASELAENSFAAYSTSAQVATALGETRLRQGRLTDAVQAYQSSLKSDPCLARTRYDWYQLLWIESMRASGYEQLRTAYQLDPDDPDIHLSWIERLPLSERARGIDGYLASTPDTPTYQKKSLKQDANRLKAILAAKNGGCRLASASSNRTTLPFQYLDKDELNRYRGFGFDVKVNKKTTARLELDTGSTGILLDRGAAKKAGLVPVTDDTISGIGDQESMSGFWAYAEDLRIGSLEFKNCLVEVSDKRSIVDVDGLIGADVFENYHVQLDFPLHQMTLSPLPKLPGKDSGHRSSLNARGTDSTAATHSAAHHDAVAGPAAGAPTIHYTDRYVAPEMRSWSPFARFGHQILINGQLKDGKPRLFLVDSGSNASILSVQAARSVGKVHADSNDTITGLNGKVKKLYTAGGIDVMFANLRDPLSDVFVMNLDVLSNDNGTEVSGILGLGTLSYLTVDIDYRDGLIHLTYDPNHGTNRY